MAQARNVLPRERNLSEEDTKSRIVQAATKLFALKGYDGTSTKEICDAAKVNIAAIHYHYGSKENLYCGIIESFGGSRLESVQRILDPANSPEELRVRLKMFVSEYFEVYLRQPELVRIVHTEMELMHARSEKVFKGTFLKLCGALVNYLRDAQKKGLVRKDLNPEIAARCLYSQLAHQARFDRANQKFYGVSLKQDSYRAEWVEHILKIFLEGSLSHENR